MAEDGQVWPLDPSRIDEENPTFKVIRRERSNKCFFYVFTVFVILSISILVFGLVVLRVKSPHLNIRSVTVRTLKYTTTSPSSFNATLVAQVTIKNPNFGHYRFESSNASIFYHGAMVGSSKVGKGQAIARKTTMVSSVVVKVRSGRLPEGANSLKTDIASGVVKLSAYAKLSGRVHLMKIINHRKTAHMNCTMNLLLKTKTIKNLRCR